MILFYPKPDCFLLHLLLLLLLIVGFFTFKIYLYSGLENGELKEIDKTGSWASPHIYYSFQRHLEALAKVIFFPQSRH